MTWILAGIIAYIVLQFAIGYWVSRSIKNQGDYINAGRSIGLGLGAFTVFATWFGAEAIVGTGGNVYEGGLIGATIDPFGYGAALIIAGLVMAMPLWRRGFVTFGDLFRERYSPGVERLSVFFLIPGSIIWGAAQIRAFGQVMVPVTDWPLVATLALAAAVVIGYTVMGGLLADAYTDFIQGIVIIFGLLVLAALVIVDMGGVSEAFAKVDPDRLDYFGGNTGTPLELMEQWAIPICGTLVSIELISRMLGTRSAATARNACVLGGLLYLIVGSIPVVLGLLGSNTVPGLADKELIIPALAEKYLVGAFYIIFVGAIISAILSTVDSILLSSGAVVSHNLVQPLAPNMGEATKLRVTRLTVAGLGILAFLIALRSTSISDLVETASAFGSAGLVVVALFGLFTKFGGPESAYAALITGGVVWIAGGLADLIGDETLKFTDTPYLLAVGAAFLAYVALALVASPSRKPVTT